MVLQWLEGEIKFNVPAVAKPCTTWYTVLGDLQSGNRPLVTLHGGPGACHGYMIPLEDLALNYGIPVVFYDQIGNGNSTRLPEKMGDQEFWSIDLFIHELENLLEKLKVRENYDLMGHSWGGMLAATYASRQPTGLNRLIISNTPASMTKWIEAASELRKELPQHVREALTENEERGTTDSEAYKSAVDVYYRKHLCRTHPFPAPVQRALDQLEEDPTTYLTMNGPSEFFVTGSLKSFDITDQLHKIDNETLLINGRYDEAQDETVAPFFNHIPKVKWHCLENSSHMSMHEVFTSL